MDNMSSKTMMSSGMAAEGEMTHAEVIEKLKKALPDEIQDCKHYAKMSKVMEHAGHMDAAKYLHAISKDEFTHAKFIYEFLSMEGIDIPESDIVKYHELETMAQHTFR